jgi:hypothetical protein
VNVSVPAIDAHDPINAGLIDGYDDGPQADLIGILDDSRRGDTNTDALPQIVYITPFWAILGRLSNRLQCAILG